MDYDKTPIPRNYHAARRLSDDSMRRWLATIRQSAPLRPGSIVADVGCGTGRFSSGLAETYQSRVIGIDRSLEMLAEARALDPGAWFCLGDAASLPLLQGSVGMIFLSNVIHHLADLERAAVGFALALKRDGLVVVRNYLREQLTQLSYLRFFPEAMSVSETGLYSKMEIQRDFERAGFQLTAFHDLEQPVADSTLHYLDKIRSRVYSDLASIPDRAFRAGVARMTSAVSGGWQPSLSEPVALFTFKKRSTAV